MRIRNVIATFVLMGFVLACGGEQPAVEEESAEATTSGSSDLLALLPADGAVTDWSREGEPRFFTPDNLWEYINGAADGYIMYGFEEVVTADFSMDSTDQQAVIDIYRMQDPVHAFGIYCQERNPDYEFLEIGVEGYMGGTALNFWHGPYYVKLTVFEESDELKQEMSKLAQHVSGKIDQPSVEPREAGYFPTENQKTRSIQFLPRDVLGQSYLRNAFEVQYQSDGTDYKIVAVLAEDEEAAKSGLSKYKEFLAGAGDQKALEGLGDEGFAGEDRFYGKVVAARSGSNLLIVLGPPSEEVGTAALSAMLSKMKES
jgi:hypothetical protein